MLTMNPRHIWPSVTLALGAMLLAGGMAIEHVDKDLILYITTLLVLPVLGAFLAAQIGQQSGQLAQLQQQSNGHQSELVGLVREQARLLAQLVPPANAAPATPVTSTYPAENAH